MPEHNEVAETDTAAATEPLTFVTVTYRAEDALQLVQARSFHLYAPASLVSRIIVIDNGHPPMDERRRARLLDAYGDLADSVDIVPAAEIVDLSPGSGWMTQQVLKLAVSGLVSTRLYVLLDAKNHLIRPAEGGDLVAPDGRARGGFHSYENHPLLPRLRTTLAYLGIEDPDIITHFPVTSTPFVVHAATARGLITDVESKAGRPFAEEFVAEDLSEFFLYSAWLSLRDPGWRNTYDGVPIEAPTVWGGAASVAGVRKAVEDATALDAGYFGVHRRALRRLDRAAEHELEEFWVDRGLVTDHAEYRAVHAAFTRDYAAAIARDRLTRLFRREPA